MVFKIVILVFFELVNNSCFAYTSYFEDFEEAIHDPDYVDKSLILKEIINAEKTIFIAAPVGFGKTFNLILMKKFLSIDQLSGERLFNHTKVFQDANFTKNEMGNYAVIYCNFQQKFPVYDYRSMLNAFREVLFRTFALYPYLVKSKKISSYDKKMITFYTGVKKHLTVKPIHILRGLHFLSKLLKTYHEKEVILLIDGYDTFILNSIFSKDLEYKYTLGFHNAFFSTTLHENEYLSRSIFVGTTCMSMKSLVQLQEYECVRFLKNEKFSPFFGITDHELDELLAKKEYNKYSKMKSEIKHWYNGYQSPDLKTQVYNTRSTLSFFLTGQLKSYWADRRAIKPIKYLLIEPVALGLLNDSLSYRPVEINSTDTIKPHHIKGIKSFAEYELWDENYGDAFIQFLMEKGYFTNVQKSYKCNDTERMILGIPNAEIGSEFKKMVTSFLTDPEEILKRLKEAVHELSYSERQNTDKQSAYKVPFSKRNRGNPRKKRIGKY